MRKFPKLITFLLFVLLSGAFYFFFTGSGRTDAHQSDAEVSDILIEEAAAAEPQDRIMSIEIGEKATYGELMRQNGVDYGVAMAIHESALDSYDLARIRQGRFIDLKFDRLSDELIELRYQIDTEEYLFVRAGTSTGLSARLPGFWQAERTRIPYEVRVRTAASVIETSMYEAAESSDIDIRAIIELANAFQWSIDFAMDPRAGDTFKFIYEERYLDGEYVMPGRIFAGHYVNSGQVHEVFYFEENEDNKGFFDAQGRSVQKMFLKAPLEFRYISSGFTTGLRYIKAFNVYTGHRAIDYAAPAGTPIRSVGDGTVTFAGWSSAGYGYLTSIRHNGTYSTNYAHQNKIAVKVGQKVKQGQVIGYVGSTGFSTGPHLHYEMIKNGAKINPLAEVLPPGEPIKAENMERFIEYIREWREILDK